MKTTVENDKKQFDAEDLNLITLAREYSDDDKARELLERLLWPKGAICPHCKCDDVYKITAKPNTKTATKTRKGVYCCAACRKQFTVTVGTVFESTHIPISKLVMAIFIICSSKKSVSAHQLHRMLDVTYKTAWFMAHRIRFAMIDDIKRPLDGTVEVDEAFIGGVGDPKTKFRRHTPVMALIERDGKMKTRVVADVSQKSLGKALNDCVSKTAVINTDEHAGYKPAAKAFEKHDTVNHSKEEYHRVNADGSVATTNSAEAFFSLLKRGVYGSWHNVSREHLPKYASEFSFRWNQRKVSDGVRMENYVPLISDKRLMYRRPIN